MTIRIDAEAVAALGASLLEIAGALESTPDAGPDRWALGPGESAPALDAVVSNWRHSRLLLARTLRDLGGRAQLAGGAYLRTEAEVTHRFGAEGGR